MTESRPAPLYAAILGCCAAALLGCSSGAGKTGVTTGDDAGMDAGADQGAADTDQGADADQGVDADPSCATPSAFTYANFGMQFLGTYCVRCHGFTQMDAQQLRFDIYSAAVVSGDSSFMPPVDPRPTLAERMNLGVWLNCGAP